MFYYAILNENMFVVELVASETEITDSNHILITEDQYTNGDLLWLYYKPDSGQFIVCDNFIGSSDWIIYKNTDRPITPKFDVWDAKADGDHNHDEDYATKTHTHTEYAVGTHNHDDLYAAKTHETDTTVHVTAAEKTAWNAKAAADHNHDSVYANINHGHTDYAATEHTHNAATTAAAGFMSATDKAKLDGIAAGATAYVHPATHPASMITGLPTSLPANGGNADTVDNCHATDFASAMHDHDSSYAAINHNHTGTYANAIHTHTDYAATSHSHSTATTAAAGFMAAADKAKLDGVAANANNYSHPASHPASMITGLASVATSGSYNDLSNKPTIPAAYTHPSTHSASMITETDSLKFLTAAERTKLAGIAANANLYTHPASHSLDMITETTAKKVMTADERTKLAGIATGANKTTVDSALSSTSTNPVQNKVINTALAGKAAASHTHSYNDLTNKPSTFTPAAHTHAQSEISGLASALSGKASTSHNHDTDYILKSLQFTANDGNIAYSYVATDDVLSKMAELACGVHTCYCPVASINAPKQTESWRFLVHKTGTSKNYGWCMAFGSRGSVYSNYIDQGNWRGWKCIHDIEPEPLWTGAYYMNASHTITPSKSLSQCANGYLLVWSDYNVGVGAQNADCHTSIIPKRNYDGGIWGGQSQLFMVPTYFADTGEMSYCGKKLYVHDTKLVGVAANSVSPGDDCVLRAIYEF